MCFISTANLRENERAAQTSIEGHRPKASRQLYPLGISPSGLVATEGTPLVDTHGNDEIVILSLIRTVKWDYKGQWGYKGQILGKSLEGSG